MRHWRSICRLLALRTLLPLLAGNCDAVWAAPEMAFRPAAVDFQEVAVGDTLEAELRATNPGG